MRYIRRYHHYTRIIPYYFTACCLAAFTTKYTTQAAYSSFSSSKMSYITTRESNGLVTVAPRDESKQSALVVICHGLGDSAEGFVDVAENLATQMPYVKFILPTAPTQPVTMNMGMPMPSWYDIVGLDERSNEKCKGIDDSIATLRSILDNEHKTTGLPYTRMAVGGFSQGGALALFTGLSMPSGDQKLAGIVLMSGYLPGAAMFRLTPGLESTPVLHCHGTDDPLVTFDKAGKSREYVTGQGATDYTIKSYPGMQHTVLPREIVDVFEFFKKILPVDDSVCVKVKAPEEMSVKELKAAIRKAG